MSLVRLLATTTNDQLPAVLPTAARSSCVLELSFSFSLYPDFGLIISDKTEFVRALLNVLYSFECSIFLTSMNASPIIISRTSLLVPPYTLYCIALLYSQYCLVSNQRQQVPVVNLLA